MRVLLGCFCVLTLLCAISVVIGHSQAKGDIPQDLKPCGDTLCYLSIVPGTTQWNSAMEVFRENPSLETRAYSVGFERADKRYSLNAFPEKDVLDPSPQAINEIELFNFDPPFRIGDIFSTFGPPCSMLNPSNGTLVLGYSKANVVVFIGPNSLTPESQVVLISLHATTNRFCAKTISEDEADNFQWRGFRQYH